MKAQFLKISGLSEKDFYKKYPTENHFFKAYPQMKKGGYLPKFDNGGKFVPKSNNYISLDANRSTPYDILGKNDETIDTIGNNNGTIRVTKGLPPDSFKYNSVNDFKVGAGRNIITDDGGSKVMLEGSAGLANNKFVGDLGVKAMTKTGSSFLKAGVGQMSNNNGSTTIRPFVEANVAPSFGNTNASVSPYLNLKSDFKNLNKTLGVQGNLNLGKGFGLSGNAGYIVNGTHTYPDFNSNRIQGNAGLTWNPNWENEESGRSYGNSSNGYKKGGRLNRYAQGTENPNEQYNNIIHAPEMGGYFKKVG